MSFQEDCARFGVELVQLVDSGVSVKEAAVAVGVPRWRCYAILRAVGRPVGRPRGRGRPVDPGRIVAVFDRTGSINRASIECDVAFSVARRALVDAGLVTAGTVKPAGKPEARKRFLALIDQGWSSARAAREVQVNVRTARDWRKGIRRVGDTRIYADGTVVDSRTKTVYKRPVTSVSGIDVAPSVISDRYLSLDDRIAIADGLVVKDSMRTIAVRIGKNVSSVSREVREHSVGGRYLPHQADRAAAAARARPKKSKLVVNTVLRAAVEEGLSRKLSPEQISHRLRRDHPESLSSFLCKSVVPEFC